MCKEFVNVLQAGFFDYAAMLSEIRKPEETAAAVRVLKDILMLLESTGNGDIDFMNDVLQDIQSMVGIARRETNQGDSSEISGSRNEISDAELRYQAAEMRCSTIRTRYYSNNMISGPVK